MLELTSVLENWRNPLIYAFLGAIAVFISRIYNVKPRPQDDQFETKPISVNYHFTRQCNYKCGFCFHTAKTSHVLPIEEAKRGLKLLVRSGMQKLNFSGGEPFLEKSGNYMGELAEYCKEVLHIDSVSIVTNGSLVREAWFRRYGRFVDILAVSCDSFFPETNKIIGRQQGSRDHLESLVKVRDLCGKYQVFQCLLIGGENHGPEALRHAESFVVSDEEFNTFIARHRAIDCLVPESNGAMQNSYLILDEYMRFLDNTCGKKEPSPSILDVGVEAALDRSGFDSNMFLKRGGRYTWTKADMKLEW